MIRPGLLVAMGAMLVMAQFDSEAIPQRCWFVGDVHMRAVPTWPGPYYLSRDTIWGGWLEWAPVLKGDRDAAARLVGFKSAKECNG